MSVVFADGFDSYAATADLARKWARAESPWTWSNAADQNGATNGILVAATTGGGYMAPKARVFGTATRIGLGFWLKVSATPAATTDIVRFISTTFTLLGAVRITTSGFLQLVNNSGSTQVLIGATNVCDNAWHWIEIAAQIGTAVLQRCVVDSTSQWNGNGTMVASGDFDHSQFASIASRTVSISDAMLYDNYGTFTVDADFPLGARKIISRRADGDDAVQFAPSTGASNYVLVDEVNGDTSDYVESSTVGDADTYDYAALGETPTTVNAVLVNSYVDCSVPGTKNYAALAKSGSTTAKGKRRTAPALALVRQDAFHVDPDTGAAWTESGIDAAKFGIEVADVVPASYVNVGTQTASGSVTSVAMNLPGSRTNGNLLVAVLVVVASAGAAVTWGAGWTTIFDYGGGGGRLVSAAYRYVDGSETAPTPSWTTSQSAYGFIAQFTGVHASAPIGRVTNLAGSFITTVTCPEVIAQASGALSFCMMYYTNGTLPAPDGWTLSFQFTAAAGKQTGSVKTLAYDGVASGAPAAANGAQSQTHAMNLEILPP